VSSETQVPVYANLHQRLEARREEAKATGIAGPRVLVVGPTDSGKSSLCRILCAYACRVGRAPTFVDVDIGQGEVSVPGTVAATPLDRLCLSIEEGYVNTTPLVYYFGHVTPSDSVPVYRNCVQRLADTVTRRLASDDTGAWALLDTRNPCCACCYLHSIRSLSQMQHALVV
jgi:polyribonucleotide 5'-hydroxyl-kinase